MRRLTKLCWLSVSLVGALSHVTLAQDPAPTHILYEDHFSDTATDSAGIFNIGWIRFGPEQSLVGSTVEQRDDALYLQMGSFGLLGGVVAQTNGLPFYILGDSLSKSYLINNDISNPNQVFSFRVKFVKITTSTFFLGTRQPQDTVDPDTTDFLVSNITQQPAYALLLDVLNNRVLMGKYSDVPLAALDPNSWTKFGEAAFTFALDTWYWAKFYLFEGRVKGKVWTGTAQDEPAAWLLEATDPEPRVTGKYSTFTMTGLPPNPLDNGDILLIDDVVVQGFGKETAVADETTIPARFQLFQNYPNPFNPETTIRYSLGHAARTQIEIYTLTGRKVRTLLDGVQSPGDYRVHFDGRDATGRPLASGLYLYRLRSGATVTAKKMLLLR